MRRMRLLVWLLGFFVTSHATAQVHHYIFFGLERKGIAAESFLDSGAEGAQLKYTWRELEPEEGHYDFSAIRADLAILRAHGKKLFLQIQDVSFDPRIVNVPKYLLSDPEYHGGIALQYEYDGKHEDKARPAGVVARRWDPAVQRRFQFLLYALGKEFDGLVEGVNLPETAVTFGESGKLFPQGFTFEHYRDGIVANMAALKNAFHRSVTMQYANFMPGEWLPWKNMSYLDDVYKSARVLRVGVGGPDLLPYKKGQMNHAYPRIKECAGVVPTGIAVQEGNYSYKNPSTGKRVTLQELVTFATDYLHVTYIFWFAEKPFYERDVLPFLNEVKRSQSESQK